MLNGYIKLHRQFSEWEWYKDINTKTLFIHCLISANFKDAKWQGITIKRGQFTTSLQHLADECGLSVRNVRTSIEKLEKTGEIIVQSTNKYTLITVCKFDVYQNLEAFEDSDRQTGDKQPTNDRQGTDKLPTNDRQQIEKDKNIEEGKEEKENYIYLGEFRKIEKGEQFRNTELDKNFHFGLFPKEWSENFQNQVLRYWRYMEDKKGDGWGIIGTITSQLSAIKAYLKTYAEKDIIEAFEDTRLKGNISWNPDWTKNRKKAEEEKNPTKIDMNPPKKATRATDFVMGQKIYTGKC